MTQNPQKEFFPNASKNGKDIEEISSLPDQPVRPNSYSLMELDTLNTKSQKLEYEVSREAKGKGDTPELKTHYRDLTIKAEEKIYFDDLDISNYITPSLTTVHQDLDKIANLSVGLLLSLMMNRTAQRIVVNGKIIIRNSTGPNVNKE